MLKREYYRIRKNLIQDVEKGNISIKEFTEEMAKHTENLNKRWSNTITQKGEETANLIMMINLLGKDTKQTEETK